VAAAGQRRSPSRPKKNPNPQPWDARQSHADGPWLAFTKVLRGRVLETPNSRQRSNLPA
jgi:hypothetical protein